MTVQALNKTKIVKKRKLKVRRFQSDRVQKVKVLIIRLNLNIIAKLEEA